MPVFASDMVSSVAYAPDEILLALSLSGLVALTVSPWIGLAVGAVILVIVLCYRLNLRAYPSGGDSSGLVVIYEQCVRTFWHSERYRDDLRYLKVWLEYVSFLCLFLA